MKKDDVFALQQRTPSSYRSGENLIHDFLQKDEPVKVVRIVHEKMPRCQYCRGFHRTYVVACSTNRDPLHHVILEACQV